jgi:hypothetical protein
MQAGKTPLQRTQEPAPSERGLPERKYHAMFGPRETISTLQIIAPGTHTNSKKKTRGEVATGPLPYPPKADGSDEMLSA